MFIGEFVLSSLPFALFVFVRGMREKDLDGVMFFRCDLDLRRMKRGCDSLREKERKEGQMFEFSQVEKELLVSNQRQEDKKQQITSPRTEYGNLARSSLL